MGRNKSLRIWVGENGKDVDFRVVIFSSLLLGSLVFEEIYVYSTVIRCCKPKFINEHILKDMCKVSHSLFKDLSNARHYINSKSPILPQ